MIGWIALVLVVAYVGVAAGFYLLQRGMMFRPSRTVRRVATDLPIEDVAFTATDGCRLHGWFVPSSRGRAVVLYCHGNNGNVSTKVDILELLAELDVSVFAFDYRGYGLSEGEPSEAGLALDAEAAWAYLTETRGVAPKDIVILGRSLGGAVACRLAVHKNPAGLALDSTFTSMPDLATRLYPWLPCRLLCRIRFDTRAIVDRLACPVMVMHSREDDLIPFDMGQALFDAAPEPKRFVRLTGDHRDSWIESDSLYARALDGFIADVLPDAIRDAA